MEANLSIAGSKSQKLNWLQRLSLLIVGVGVFILLLRWAGSEIGDNKILLPLSLISITLGILLYTFSAYRLNPKGYHQKDVWFHSAFNRGIIGWLTAVVFTGFYVFLYWYPQHIGLGDNNHENTGLIGLFDPLSIIFKGKPASQWFMYGTLYTLLIVFLGIKFLIKYRNNKYQFYRTIVVICSQLFLAYLIPEILEAMNYNGVTSSSGEWLGWYDGDIKNTWPLDYDFFDNWHLDAMQQKAYQPIGKLYLFIGLAMFLIVTPVLTYLVGKRWYCSWVCGCGGLAETAGDAYRHLSSKKLSSWKLERWLVYPIMLWVLLMTLVTLYGYIWNTDNFLGLSIYNYFQKPYGFVIGAAFSGVIGVGFYPILGNRVWCRFGCPMAGYMGIIQRFKSRFRITTNGGQCISCGNCSTYCEQGIDVRFYAQKGQNIVRASCVGCGVCAEVCPRGVLKLENGPDNTETRTKEPEVILGNKGLKDYLNN